MSENQQMFETSDFAQQFETSENNKYETIKQQKKRMENLTKMIQSYRQKVQILNTKIETLQYELQQERKIKRVSIKKVYQNDQFMHQARRKQEIILQQQYVIENLKLQIIKAYQIEESRRIDLQQTYTKYKNIADNYQKLQTQLVRKQKENQKIKQLILRNRVQQYNKQNKSQIEALFAKKSQKYSRLKEQFKQQIELIEKYQRNQEKHLKLLDLLKKQKQKICLCHYKGRNRQSISNKQIINNI